MLRTVLNSIVESFARLYVRRAKKRLSACAHALFDTYIPEQTNVQRVGSSPFRSYPVTLSAVALRGVTIPQSERMSMAHTLHESAMSVARYVAASAASREPVLFSALPSDVSPQTVLLNSAELYALLCLCSPNLGSAARPHFIEYVLALIFDDEISASTALTEIAVLLINAANPVVYSMFYTLVAADSLKPSILPVDVFVRRTCRQ